MRNPKTFLLFWIPRLMGVAFALFISLFALDVLEEAGGFWHTVRALSLHLIPTAIIVACLALAWRWGWIGALTFPGLGIAYLIMAWGRFHWATYVLIAGPLFLVGTLFLADWLIRQRRVST